MLITLATGIVLQRVHTYAEPPDRDLAVYAVIGHEMLGGRPLYADLYDNKPPLLHSTFAAAERLVGYGASEVFLINVVVTLCTLAGCYAAGRAVGGEIAGLSAAALWTLLCGDLWLQANQPNGEVFINAAITPAVAFLMRSGRPEIKAGVVVGGLLTVASLYEQHVVVTAAALAVGYVIAGGPGERGRRAEVMALAAAVGAVTWAGLGGYFAAVGRLGAAAHILFADNVAYGGSLAANLAASLKPKHVLPECMRWIVPLGLLGLFASFLGRPAPRWTSGAWSVWLSWVAGSWLTVALPGRFFPHYYQLWLPPACVAGGMAAARLLGGRWGVAAMVRALALATALVPLAARELLPCGWTPDEWAAHKFPSDNFVEQAVLSSRLAATLRKDERFWLLGDDDSVYFLTQRSPVTGLFFMDAINAPPNTAYRRRLLADLSQADPPLVIVRLSSLATLPADSPIIPWVRSRYNRVDTDLGCPSYGFWVRRGNDDLRRRLLTLRSADGK